MSLGQFLKDRSVSGITTSTDPALRGFPGIDGTVIRYGTTAPTSGIGNNGDAYINTATNMLYGPKAAGAWPAGVSLIGAQGPQGIQGIQGVKGDTGAQGLQGIQGLQGLQGPAGTGTGGGIDVTTLTSVTTVANPTTATLVVEDGGTGKRIKFADWIAQNGTTLAQLNAAGALGATNLFPLVQDGVNEVHATVDDLYSYLVARMQAAGLFSAASPVAPGQVTGLTAGAATDTTQVLNWTAPSTGTAPFTYKVERSAAGANSWTTLNASVSGTTYTVTGLTASTSYDYRVSATNSASTGAVSTTLTTATTATPVSAPGQVTGLAAGTATSTTQDLTWTAVSGATSYKVEKSPAGANAWTTAAATVSGTSYTVTGLTASTSYDYRVSGNNTAGTGTPSATVTKSTTAAATVPGAPTIGAATAGDTFASVAFTAPGSNGGSAITGYTVTSSPGNITATGSTSPINVTGLTNGTAYIFTITATNAIGTSTASAASNSVTPAAAAVGDTLTSLTATTSDGATPATYTANTGANYNSFAGGWWSKHFAASTDGSITLTEVSTVAFKLDLRKALTETTFDASLNIENAYGAGQQYYLNAPSGGGTVGAIDSSIKVAANDPIKVERINSSGVAGNTATLIYSVYKAGAWKEVGRITNVFNGVLYPRWTATGVASCTSLQSSGLV